MQRISFVVPTRNRMHTALPCIRSLLAIEGDFQVVVRDCSDTPVLRDAIDALCDARITYQYASPTSMTDNWNGAFELCSGDIVCYIGDDDGIIPSAKRVVDALAARGDLEIAVSSATVVYSWPDYPGAGEAGILGYPHPKDTINVHTVEGRSAIERSIRLDAGAPSLPRIYHGFVSRTVMERVKKKTGAYFSTVNPDWFSYYMLAGVTDSYHVVDCPLTIVGRSGDSNTGRNIKSKSDYTHINEYGLQAPEWDVLIPPAYTLESSLGHGIVKALRALEDPTLLELYREHYMPQMYARCILRNPRNAGRIVEHLFRRAYQGHPALARARASADISWQMAKIVGGRICEHLRRKEPGQLDATMIRVGGVVDIGAAIDTFEADNPMLCDIAVGRRPVAFAQAD